MKLNGLGKALSLLIEVKMSQITKFFLIFTLFLIGTASATDGDMNGLIDEHEAITEYLGGMTCMGCHPNEASLMLQSSHYLWEGANGKGMKNIQDTYCTNAAGTPQWAGIVRTPGPDGLMMTSDDNAGIDGVIGTSDDLKGPDGILGTADDGLEVGGGCLMCHVGFGFKKIENLGVSDAWNDPGMMGLPETINVDCLVCHAETGYNRLPMFMGDEANPTAFYGLPGGPGYPFACFDRSLYLANPTDPTMSWCISAGGGSTISCTDGNMDGMPDEEMCFYDASPTFSFDDRLVMNDDRWIISIPVPVGFSDAYFTLNGKPGLGKNVQGVGPRIITSDFGTNPNMVPQASATLGGMAWPSNNRVAIDAAQQIVGKPSDEACLRCHATSGGSSNAKRGDIGMSNFDEISEEHDRHMGGDIFGWGSFKCVDCHWTPRDGFTYEITSFDMAGKGMDIAADGNRLKCLDCHYITTHEELNPILDTHSEKVACQTCHIPKVAKLDSTELEREWMNEFFAPYGETVMLTDPLGPMFGGVNTYDISLPSNNGIWRPETTKQANLTPGNGIEYVWWNGDVDFVDEFETITLSTDTLVSNVPLGDITDGKIYPVKVQETQWFVDQGLGPIPGSSYTVPLDVGLLFQGWGVEAALRFGAYKNNQMHPAVAMPYMMFDPTVNMICATDPMANGCVTPADLMYARGIAKSQIDSQMTYPLNVGVQKTSRLASLNHEVAPKEDALTCDDCHGASPILNWVGLGYPEDDPCDDDRDGYTDTSCGGIDCDDNDAAVNPFATEYHNNGIDDNCDGRIDELVAELYVDDDGICGGEVPCFTSIKNALDAANDFDDIFVYDGNYSDRLDVIESVNLIAQSQKAVVGNGSYEFELRVEASHVNISGFTIIGETNILFGGYCGIIGNIIKGDRLSLMHDGDNNVVTGNFIRSGIELLYSKNNLIYNNIFNYTTYFSGTVNDNQWNIELEPGTNIIGGSTIGGNYWAKTDGSGYSETCADINGDGICDDPYYQETGNVDYYPLSQLELCYDNDNDNYDDCDPIYPLDTDGLPADCDDNDSEVNPGETELCNNMDDNCDGQVDEGLETNIYYRDYDGDSFGDPLSYVDLCSIPSGYVTDFTDCNDNDPNINPNGVENCNGLDDDCDSIIDEGVCGVPEILYVDDDPGCQGNSPCYSSIQEAVDFSVNSNIINVLPGTYDEIINITKSINLMGSGKEVTIINGIERDHLIEVTTDNVNISGFTINGFDKSILMSGANECTISNNHLSKKVQIEDSSNFNLINLNNFTGDDGVFMENSDFNEIVDNDFFNNHNIPIGLYGFCNSTTISNNKISKGMFGIYAYLSNYTLISENEISNSDYGIMIGSGSNSIINNQIINNDNGLSIHREKNRIENNLIQNDDDYIPDGPYAHPNSGLIIFGENQFVYDNIITNFDLGILLHSNEHEIVGNHIYNNYGFGIEIYPGASLIFNNLFNNTENFNLTYSDSNTWFLSKTPGTNIAGGPFLGGNFWANPDGTGFSETCTDSDEDRICDSEFTMNEENYDPYPLTFNTPVGLNVEVSMEFGTLSFEEVTGSGITLINSVDPDEIPLPPDNFQLAGTQYDITSTATFSGIVEICLNYDDSGIIDENTITLMHFESDTWIDVTTSLDTNLNKICGSVSSLSPFAVIEETSSCSINFPDVSEGHWAHSYIEYLYCNGIVNGYPDGTFQPGNSITRGQFAKMIVNANGISEYYPATPTFSDVPSDHWSYGYVEAAVQAGIISGYPDGTFKPANQVTRAQISAMIARSRGWTYSGGLEDFPDVPPTHWAYNNIMSMKEKGIIGGYPDGTFLPANQATRGQNSKMIANMMQTP